MQNSETKKIIVAIDGFSSCGKSTMAKNLARETNYIYIDTGAMYRAVSLFCIRNGWMTENEMDIESIDKNISDIKLEFINNDKGNADIYLNGENVESQIRTLEVANGASRVSTIAAVRKELVRQQQLMGSQKGIVMDGRDIGTVVFPNADLKLFMTASPETKAQRRFDELIEKGQQVTFEEVLQNVQERDYIDTHRDDSPLVKAEDAIEIDNSHLSKKEQFELVMELVNEELEEPSKK